jgi:peptidoglycan/LPS O-acetylase OafA/YrhL
MICLFIANLLLQTHTFDTLLPSFLASLIYSHNLIFHHVPLLTVVAWSLEVEIQFYVLAPFLFKILYFPATYLRILLTGLIVLFVTLQHFYPPLFLSLYGNVQHFLIGILIADFYVRGFAVAAFQKKWVVA